jgi:hypothetical protein
MLNGPPRAAPEIIASFGQLVVDGMHVCVVDAEKTWNIFDWCSLGSTLYSFSLRLIAISWS